MVKKSRTPGSVKKLGLRTLRVFSRHPSHAPIKKAIKLPFLACLRLGSTNEGTLGYKVEINSTEAIKNSSSKLRMKRCFSNINNKVKTADWWVTSNGTTFNVADQANITLNSNELPYPIVVKHHFGSRGEGNTLIKTEGELKIWMKGKTLGNYIFEKYYSYNKEYRLHVDSEGCFYTCRKMLKEGTPNDEKWHRHDSNSVWILEENKDFDRPNNWNDVVTQCKLALTSVGLDVGAVDLKIQDNVDKKGRARQNPDFIVIEINSAPSFGNQTLQKYLQQIPIIAKRKYESLRK